MAYLTAAERELKQDFLRQMRDGRLERPVAEASGLPNIAYTCSDFYRLEQASVFYYDWVFAGFRHELRKVGDMRPIEIAGQPLVLVLDDSGGVNALHNVCRHRGARLVSECRNAKKFVCPNHSWSYGLDGRLIARPHFNGGERHDVNRADCHRADLKPVRCVTWHDWIFVNLSGDANDFESCIAPISARLDGYDFDALEFSETLEFEIGANWKLAIENFIEPYHVFSCHPWLNRFVGMDERIAPGFRDQVLYCGYEFRKTDPARGGSLPWFPQLPADKANRGDWFVLFPNFGFEIFPDQLDVFVSWPLAPDRCRETIALYFVGAGASDERYADARAHVVRNWNDLNREDVGVIERMQAGRYSEAFDGGVLSPYWDPVQQHFARLVTASLAR